MEVSLNKDSNENLNSLSHKKKYWRLLRNVLKAISLFKNLEARETSVNEIIEEIKKIPTDNDYRLFQYQVRERSAFARALKDIRREQSFLKCVHRGHPEDLDQIKIELNDDPYRLLRDSSHPLALMNKRNQDGLTPLYIACRNGNYEVVKYLLDQNADFLINSTVETETESNLEVAVRWGHLKIVLELLKYKWPKSTISKARKLTKDSKILKILKNPQKKHSFWCFCNSSKD